MLTDRTHKASRRKSRFMACSEKTQNVWPGEETKCTRWGDEFNYLGPMVCSDFVTSPSLLLTTLSTGWRIRCIPSNQQFVQ